MRGRRNGRGVHNRSALSITEFRKVGKFEIQNRETVEQPRKQTDPYQTTQTHVRHHRQVQNDRSEEHNQVRVGVQVRDAFEGQLKRVACQLTHPPQIHKHNRNRQQNRYQVLQKLLQAVPEHVLLPRHQQDHKSYRNHNHAPCVVETVSAVLPLVQKRLALVSGARACCVAFGAKRVVEKHRVQPVSDGRNCKKKHTGPKLGLQRVNIPLLKLAVAELHLTLHNMHSS